MAPKKRVFVSSHAREVDNYEEVIVGRKTRAQVRAMSDQTRKEWAEYSISQILECLDTVKSEKEKNDIRAWLLSLPKEEEPKYTSSPGAGPSGVNSPKTEVKSPKKPKVEPKEEEPVFTPSKRDGSSKEKAVMAYSPWVWD